MDQLPEDELDDNLKGWTIAKETLKLNDIAMRTVRRAITINGGHFLVCSL